jgi:hypothetical protein
VVALEFISGFVKVDDGFALGALERKEMRFEGELFQSWVPNVDVERKIFGTQFMFYEISEFRSML